MSNMNHNKLLRMKIYYEFRLIEVDICVSETFCLRFSPLGGLLTRSTDSCKQDTKPEGRRHLTQDPGLYSRPALSRISYLNN